MAQRQDPEFACTAGLCRRNALHVVRLAWTTHPHIGFDAAGVRWLDGHINDSRKYLAADMADEFMLLMGCFYGECLIAEFAGRWAMSGSQLGVYESSLGYTYPFNAVTNQIERGESASISRAFETAVEYLRVAA